MGEMSDIDVVDVVGGENLVMGFGDFRFGRGAYFFFFFFSSRRRHTRSLRDWSSDVCSSDLAAILAAAIAHSPEAEEILRGARTRLARKPSALSRELLRNFPKSRGRRGSRRDRKSVV